MVQQTTAETRGYKWGDENFPVLYEDQTLRVYKNPSGEIFVENKLDERSKIRVTPDRDGLSVTAHDGILIPWAINGLPAFLVRGKRS